MFRRNPIRLALWPLLAGVALYGLAAEPAAGQGRLARFDKASLVIETGSKTLRFEIEIARSERQQAQGLMFRRRMAPDAGMLFVYRPAQRISMWMRNTLIPLDMIFIAPDGSISHIVERTVPLSEEVISSKGAVIGVLELNGGTAERLGIKRGHRAVAAALGSKDG